MQRFRIVTALAFVLALAGCGGGASPTTPNRMARSDADDIAQQLAMTASTDHGSGASIGRAPLPASAGRRRAEPLAAGAPASAFWDTTIVVGPATYQWSLTFYGPGGAVQPLFNPLTTMRISSHLVADGAIDLPGYAAGWHHDGTLDATGTTALEDTLTFNGTALDTAYSAFASAYGGAQRWGHLSCGRTTANVKALKDTSVAKYPLSGTITWVVTATRLRSASRADVERTLNATAVLTFNGTQYPQLVVSGGWTYLINLKTGAILRG